MIRYNITISKLLSEYMNFTSKDTFFGDYIIKTYWDKTSDFDYDVQREYNNGVAYKMILNRIYQQDLEKTS